MLFTINNYAQIITTIAGSGALHGLGYGSFTGDYGQATLATMRNPTGITYDNNGNIYIADRGNHRIRQIDTNGIIITIAGNGISGYRGDDSVATIAEFCDIGYIKIGQDGNLYIPDVCNSRIRKINNLGIISTIIGNDTMGCSGDGGLATAACIAYPYSIIFDNNGNIFFSDGSNRVRKINSSGIINRIAGSDSLGGYSGDGGLATNAVLDHPVDIAIDNIGTLYISDLANNVIRKVDTFGVITNFAGTNVGGYNMDGILATNAQIYCPEGIVTVGAGNVFISDCCNMRVRRIDHLTNIITTIAGNGTEGFNGDNGPATDAELDSPAGLAFDKDGNLYIVDGLNNRIRKVTNAGVPLRVRGAESGEVAM